MAAIGVFESLRAYGGRFFALEEHLERFFESAKTVGIKIPESRSALKQRLYKALKDSGKKDAFVRLTLIGAPKKNAAPLLFTLVSERKHPALLYKRGVALKTTAVKRNLSHAEFPEAKSTNFINQVLATLEPAPAGNYEILFLDPRGHLTEARTGNIFFVKGGRLFTPPPHGLLNGVTRRLVIKYARLKKIFVEEKPLTRHELFNADEAFLTNTSWEILPVREADGRRIGRVTPGPLTERLQALFHKEVQKEIRKHRNGKD